MKTVYTISTLLFYWNHNSLYPLSKFEDALWPEVLFSHSSSQTTVETKLGMNDRVDILIPVLNERENLSRLYSSLKALPGEYRLIFIDNCSTDGSLEYLHRIPGALVIEHPFNRGYGGSLKSGMNRATAEKIIIIDADCEYHPDVIPKIVEKLESYDVVHTSRFLTSEPRSVNLLRSVGNKCITAIFNLLFHTNLTDLYTGCKGYRRRCLLNLPLQQNGFEHVLEVSARLAANRVVFHEVPVRYQQRAQGVSKMRHIPETVKYLFLVIYYRLRFAIGGS